METKLHFCLLDRVTHHAETAGRGTKAVTNFGLGQVEKTLLDHCPKALILCKSIDQKCLLFFLNLLPLVTVTKFLIKREREREQIINTIQLLVKYAESIVFWLYHKRDFKGVKEEEEEEEEEEGEEEAIQCNQQLLSVTLR
ncbi:hypothetical protein T4E_1936 [Trichinella pseudospiralis]|uniref:Uncharacterized protein n=1 Tax=Trichinella pseudospiralis TaxID=6337 RepID=A0A0V0Y8N6_TRIPS|nr:hypothetical protein T4E_1936 [Trichinella pseudospiralis]